MCTSLISKARGMRGPRRYREKQFLVMNPLPLIRGMRGSRRHRGKHSWRLWGGIGQRPRKQSKGQEHI